MSTDKKDTQQSSANRVESEGLDTRPSKQSYFFRENAGVKVITPDSKKSIPENVQPSTPPKEPDLMNDRHFLMCKALNESIQTLIEHQKITNRILILSMYKQGIDLHKSKYSYLYTRDGFSDSRQYYIAELEQLQRDIAKLKY